MTYWLGDSWRVTSELQIFGHVVRFHQNGSAVIMEVDGICFVGDAVDAGFIFPNKVAICPSLEDAKRAIEMAWAEAHKGE